jgi:hypothetical protein
MPNLNFMDKSFTPEEFLKNLMDDVSAANQELEPADRKDFAKYIEALSKLSEGYSNKVSTGIALARYTNPYDKVLKEPVEAVPRLKDVVKELGIIKNIEELKAIDKAIKELEKPDGDPSKKEADRKTKEGERKTGRRSSRIL